MELETILEMIKRERVVRDGKWKMKYSSDKEGYKVVNKDGTRSEVKMSPTELRKRKKAARKAAKKRKASIARINAKRKRSLAKRG